MHRFGYRIPCELSRSSAYSEDLRWRVVWQKYALGYKTIDISQNLNIHRSTVDRITSLFHRTGSVAKRSILKKQLLEKLLQFVDY